MQEFSVGNKNINKDAHQMIRAMSVSCLPRIHTCACAIKSKQTATSYLYTFIQSNLLSPCKLCIHFVITQKNNTNENRIGKEKEFNLSL